MLQPTSLVASDNFGSALDRDGNTLAVGAPEIGNVLATTTGQVFIFNRVSGSQWDEVALLAPADGAAGDTFGSALGLEADTLLVGAPRS